MQSSAISGVSAFLLAAAATAAGQPVVTRHPYHITCTTGMVTDIVRAVAGDKAEVDGIIGEGIDPHLYQATRSDVARLLKADVIFYSGLMLEGKMSDALIKVGRSRPVYAVTELVDATVLLEPPEFAGHYDPHLWMDVSLWKRCTEMVANTLGDASTDRPIDPSNAEYYMENYRRYAEQLDALHAYAQKAVASIPESSRVLITAHDAFNYFGRAYGIEVLGIQGISTESEAGVADINRLVDLIVNRKVKAVFVETSVSEKNVRALIEGAKARGHDVKIGGRLFSDAMGAPGTYEGTYIGMLDHNTTTIVRALGGEAPARGLNSRLATTDEQK
jgi:manganese/zinc/iron transport system substrate-binding protein